MQVEDWLKQHGLERFAARFQEHEISVDLLETLTEEDLREIGLPLGARKRFLSAVSKGATPKDANGERRQVTVLFCDLVDYTGLATQLDPEDLENLMDQVVELCRKEMANWGGYVGNYLGDGVLVYFGWPLAYEDAPERAAHASRQLINAVSGLKGPDESALAMRIGIATGLVLIGHRVEAGRGEIETAYGKTPNLAARLETLAQPGEVLLDAATKRLLPQRLFSCTDLGRKSLKGFADPMRVWRLDHARTTARTSSVRTATAASGRLQGRDTHLKRLERQWLEVCAEHSMRMVWLSGEAGIGKSHLTAHFQHLCTASGGQVFELQCWPYNDHTTLYPVIACLNARAAAFATTTSGANRRAAFESLAEAHGLAATFYTEKMGDLLDIGSAVESQTEDMRRAEWFSAIAEDLCAMSQRAPVLWVIEDIHWSDPVTLSLLEYLRRACASCPVMVVATSRPHFHQSWEFGDGVDRLELERVDRDAAQQMIDDLVGTRNLSRATRRRILEASDGVPLFIQELSRDLLERADHVDDESHLSIPATLQGVLSARLDAAKSAKPVAQMASCIGRVFSLDLLDCVSHHSREQVESQLGKLEDLALIERHDPTQNSYIFRHALIQESAYQSQPKARRRKVHGAIADALALEQDAEALQIANHMTAAERFDDAITWWSRAGDNAARRSAQREAGGHYRRALDLVARLPDSTDRADRQLAISLALGPVLSASDGYGAETVGALYAEAAELSDAVGRPADRFAVRRGLWLYRQMSAQYHDAEQAAQDMLDLSSEDKSGASRLEAERALGATAFMLGKLQTAHRFLTSAINGYASGLGQDHVLRFGDDPGLASMAYLGSTLWYLGDPQAARACCDELLEKTRKIRHPFSMARSLTFSAYTFHLMRDFDRLIPVAEEAASHADKFEFPFHAGVGRILWGWGLCQIGDQDTGWPIMERGYQQYETSGSHMLQPLYLSLMADIADRRGSPELARDLSNQAIKRIEASREALVLPEVLRLCGELARRRGDMEVAKALIDRAVEVARSQGSRLCLIRAMVSGVALNRSYAPGLEEELAGFAPDVQSADLDAARAALAALEGQADGQQNQSGHA